jgi:hypothetical protein
MLDRLHRKFNNIEQRKAELLEAIGSIDENLRNEKPTGENWSAVMVAEHLYNSETSVLHNIKKYSGKGKPKVKGIYHVFRSLILKLALKSKMKFKAPPIKEIIPEGNTSFATLTENWNALRKEWEEHLNNYGVEDINNLIFKHPAAGLMTIEQTVTFMGQHVEHHIHQVQRIKKDLAHRKKAF